MVAARKTLTVRIAEGLYHSAREIARERGVPLNALILQALEEFARREEQARLFGTGQIGADLADIWRVGLACDGRQDSAHCQVNDSGLQRDEGQAIGDIPVGVRLHGQRSDRTRIRQGLW